LVELEGKTEKRCSECNRDVSPIEAHQLRLAGNVRSEAFAYGGRGNVKEGTHVTSRQPRAPELEYAHGENGRAQPFQGCILRA
jgi:hypothetical protein